LRDSNAAQHGTNSHHARWQSDSASGGHGIYASGEAADFFEAQGMGQLGSFRHVCVEPIRKIGKPVMQRDVDNLKTALEGVDRGGRLPARRIAGFAQGAGPQHQAPSVVWAKLSALVEGARLASRQAVAV
jgi:hypothetical protein